MTLIIADRVQETTTTTGTGTMTLAGASTQMQSFVSAIGAGNTTYYCVLSGNGVDWEVGLGTVASGPNTLSRDTLYATSNSGSAISLTGTSTVFCTQLASGTPTNRVIYPQFTTSSTLFGATGVFVSTSAYAVSEGDAYRFHVVVKKSLSSDTSTVYVANSAKTKGYIFAIQTDSNMVLSSYDGSSHALRASGTGQITNAAGETIITGEFAFGTSANWVHWPSAGFPVTNTINNFVGDSFYIGISPSPNGVSNIIKATFTKIGNN